MTDIYSSNKFVDLMNESADAVRRFAYRLTSNPDDADDLVQDALVRAYASFDSYRRDLPFRTWIFTILRRCWIDTVRTKRRQATISGALRLDQMTNEDGSRRDIADYSSIPERVVLGEILSEESVAALMKLCPTQRLVMAYSICGMDSDDIAHVTGHSVDKVVFLLSRARVRLRTIWRRQLGR